jgi:uncharacterized protein (TIGR04255 family)
VDEFTKLNNQPLRFALAEFRFTRVMEIQKYIPQIQDELRKSYPILNEIQEQTMQIQSGGISVSTAGRWSFLSEDRKNAVDINQDRLFYCTSNYPRFEGFASACRSALDVFVKVVDPGLLLRLGLRYGDLVTFEQDEKPTEFVNEIFLFPDGIDELGEPKFQKSETFLDTAFGTIAIRSLYGKHGLSILPDAILPIEIDSKDDANDRLLLDFDHFWEAQSESVKFRTDAILEKLSGLHEISRLAFWTVTTKHAREIKWA